MISLCNGKDFSFTCKQNSFSQERLCTWPHFESEGFWNSEVAYSEALARSGAPWKIKFYYLCIHEMTSYVRPSMLANVNVTLAMSPNHIQSVFNLTLDIHVTINWQPSKYGIRWPVLHISRAQVYNSFNSSVLKLSLAAGLFFSWSLAQVNFFGKNSVCYFLIPKRSISKFPREHRF